MKRKLILIIVVVCVVAVLSIVAGDYKSTDTLKPDTKTCLTGCICSDSTPIEGNHFTTTAVFMSSVPTATPSNPVATAW